MNSDDKDALSPGASSQLPDPHGQAALLLVESLLHGLLARSIISLSDAIEIVQTAENVQVDVADAADGAGAPMWQSHALLSRIAQSLITDTDGAPTPIHLVP